MMGSLSSCSLRTSASWRRCQEPGSSFYELFACHARLPSLTLHSLIAGSGGGMALRLELRALFTHFDVRNQGPRGSEPGAAPWVERRVRRLHVITAYWGLEYCWSGSLSSFDLKCVLMASGSWGPGRHDSQGCPEVEAVLIGSVSAFSLAVGRLACCWQLCR